MDLPVRIARWRRTLSMLVLGCFYLATQLAPAAALAAQPSNGPTKPVARPLGAAPAVAPAARTTPSAVVGCPGWLRPQDQIWLINTRNLPCSTAFEQASKTSFSRLDANGAWVAASREEFLTTDDPGVPTTIWIHGNRISAGMARDWVGPTVYRALARQAPSERSWRYVIWSWPSDRIDAGQLEDVRVKAFRTRREAYYLARLLDELDPKLEVSLMGYSFGARIINGGLHLLGGGKLGEYALASRLHPQRAPVRTVLLAAAGDNDWMLPGRQMGNALSQVDQMLNIYNGCDAVLEHYHLLYGRRACQEALGYTGLVGLNLLTLDDRRKIVQFDACCIVGSEHEWQRYFESSALVARMVPNVFFMRGKSEVAPVASRPTRPPLAAAESRGAGVGK